MKNRIRVIKERYAIDEKHKTVRCTLTCDTQLTTHPAARIIYTYMVAKFPAISGVTGTFTVTATSRCHPDDVFDKELGKRIAESRAKAKAFNLGKRMYTSVIADINAMIEQLEKTKNGCIHTEEVERAHVETLIKS